MLAVERDGSLQGRVADDVAVREVLGYNAGAGFVFLGDVVVVAGGIVVGGVGGA